MEREYIGIDLHKQFCQACAVDVAGARRWEGRFPRSASGIAALQARCSAASAIAVEAMGPTWAFVDTLAPTGARVCVVDPRKTKLKAGFAAKTDRLDARRLAEALRRESVVSIYVPPPAIRELRELCRGRHQVIRLRSRVSQMIRAVLLRSGVADVPVRRVFSARGLAWLEHVALPPVAAATLQRWRRPLHERCADQSHDARRRSLNDARSWSNLRLSPSPGKGSDRCVTDVRRPGACVEGTITDRAYPFAARAPSALAARARLAPAPGVLASCRARALTGRVS